MSTAISERPSAAPKSNAVTLCEELLRSMVGERRILIDDVSWEEYEAILEYRDTERRAAHLYYDRGRLELVTHSNFHERYSRRLLNAIMVLAEEFGTSLIDLGETTVSRADLERGFQPDGWYYIEDRARAMSRETLTRGLDFRSDPPPDLAFEIEVSRSLTDRLGLFAAIGVGEIWRFDGETLSVAILENGGYSPRTESRFFPGIPVAELARFLLDTDAANDISLRNQIRDWVHTQMTPEGTK